MTKKKLIRRALMGDKQAQKECTAKGIVLPCPFCGASGDDVNLDYNRDISQFWIHCWKCRADGPLTNYNANDTEALWNTRPAPPIGRCEECEHYNTNLHYCDILSQEPDYGEGHYVLMLPGDFCSYFEPRED